VKIGKIYGAKLIKQQILLLKTSQFKTVCKDDSRYVTQLKQRKNQKGDITCQHIDYMAMCC